MKVIEKQNDGFWDKIFKGELEFNRFAIISIALIVVGCSGGIVMWSGGVESTIQLAITVALTMTVLTLILAVQPMKWIMNMSILALVLDIILIVYNLSIA